jgi:PTH1 family peptidyl-tRNA hydrolase
VKPSFIVLGLGNPGEEYARTRHNFGWLVLDEIAREERLQFARGDGPYRACTWNVGGLRGVLAKPTTYMNRSGAAARRLRELYPDVPFEKWLVVSDDLDLPLGRIRLRAGGGAGGHNGMRSLIDALQTNEFPRLRLGIGRPMTVEREEVVDWVTEPFTEEEAAKVPDVLKRAAQSVRDVIREGVIAAMNRTNSLSLESTPERNSED